MADAYLRYGDGRHPAAAELPPQVAKRQRSDYEMQTGHVARDTDTVNAAYDRYLRSAQIQIYGGDPGRPMSSGLAGHHHVDDPRITAMVGRGSDPSLTAKGLPVGVGSQPVMSLPPDASSTLFVEGLPSDCTRREVSHIFRPFVGYKEVRLVTKESRRPGGDPLVLCFVDFQSPAHAATTMDAIQGYKFDEHDRESTHIRLQFARFPGARSGGGSRGRR